jgi:ankyrin repeat protein
MSGLLYYARIGDLAKMKRLLAEGRADITERDDEGRTALSWAAAGDHLATVRWLLNEGGSKITERDGGGRTALAWTLFHGHDSMMKFLVTEGYTHAHTHT